MNCRCSSRNGNGFAGPGSTGAKLPFLMYPQAENSSGRLDSLDPATFVYKMAAKEITAA